MTLPPLPIAITEKGQHYDFIKATVNDAFKGATLNRGIALAATPLTIQPWYSTAPPAYLAKLSAANLKAWNSQNQVDHLLARTDLYAFAEPLLKAKIKERHGIEPDVKTTYLRLYIPAEKPWYNINVSQGVVTRTVSLLDAALHNFASSETVGHGSDYISKPDERGLFDVLAIKQHMPISQFQALCRDLDIGEQYKKHLESYLLPGEPVAESVLQYKVNSSQKDALAVAAHLALIKEEIPYDAYKMVLNLAEDKSPLLLNGHSIRCSDLKLLGTRLTGVLLLLHGTRDSRGVRRLIVYIPHDPDHPLKEYASLKAFKDELTRQLREDKLCASTGQTYRQFFSQFVDQQQRGHFFAELKQRLFIVRYNPRQDPTDQRPPWREVPVENPNLEFKNQPLQGDYWRHAYQQKLNKILNDAREIAVSTADTDSKARWAWWDNFKKIVSDIFNAALLIATPFVPGLGEVMMAYTAYQLTTDVIEGVVDLAEGLWQEAAGHVISVVTDVIQLAAFAAGAQIGEVFKVKLSKLVDNMKAVRLPDGQPSLWHPDLAPYARQELTLSADSKPDPQGLHDYGKEKLVSLEGQLYSVEKAYSDAYSKTHHIKHPKRSNAYRPKIEHNGHGAWLHEAETPQDWTDATLMRRLGHRAERFSPSELEQIRISSGTDHDMLRQMHVQNSPPPPLLADTLKRASAYDDVRAATSDIRAGRPIDPQAVWLEPMLTGLPGWPTGKALEVYADASLTGYSHKYGNPQAPVAETLSISLGDLNAGRLPERVVDFLAEDDLKQLLGSEVARNERVSALRSRLADAVDERRSAVADRMYQATEQSGKVDLRVVRRTFPELPLPLAEKLVAQASPAELQRIADENRLPLRLKTQARELNFEASAVRAYDGFYRDEWLTADTERLALNTLRVQTDTFADLRIEVRDGSYDGPLRCSVGPEEATTVRRLIRDEHGRYEVLNADNRSLHAADDFYQSILQAVPAETLSSVGYQRGQGRPLKLWLMEQSAAPAERRAVLAEPPIRAVASIETETLVRGWPRWLRGSTPAERVSDLYPRMRANEVQRFIEKLRIDGDPAEGIERLEKERQHFQETLQNWRHTYPDELQPSGEFAPGVNMDFTLNGGQRVRDQLIACFERRSEMPGERGPFPGQGYTLDLSSEFVNGDLLRWWRDLRKQPGMQQHLDQITALRLDNRHLPTNADELLGSFPKLRQLSARQCGLTDIPASLGQMRHLEELDLTDNRIRMTAEASERLGGLIRLQSLNLNGNPLHEPPNVAGMYRLRSLSLAKTGIETWPEGLFKVGNVDKHRPRGFMLDMRSTPIRTLPEVKPGSDQAFVLSRTRFDTARLSNEDRVRFGNYRKSTGFSIEPAYSKDVADELRHWQEFDNDAQIYSPSQALRQYREESWHDLMDEPDSEGFFSVIRKQRESRDYLTGDGRRQLTQRVWDMIEAASLDTKLREKLFKQAVSPDDCGDLGAQLFNSLGIKVLVSKAYAAPTSSKVLDETLVGLARSAARLKNVGEEAKAEFSRQEQQHLIDPGNPPPDEVEIYLAFETGLAEKLELPWQSQGMLYDLRSGVKAKQIDRAHDMIMNREKGDGLVSAMIDLAPDNFWEEHLRKTHPTQYETNDRLFEEKPGLLDELREAQAQWANATPQTPLNQLARKMEGLAKQLGIPQADVFSGEVMSEARYNKLLDDIGYERKELSRRLTLEAMISAGL
ncbi:hypothetical protein PspR84_23440 [Pseudomonas sp. R84]|uniref:dermonecrotic toxin domain-containing protein n=1 Tax=Pseudomonas sp. R84 TaxID=1573712 RepID=UPI00132022D9|nr:DUF6543 domain-containing protein [Pseudomonas sp. R84]QHC97465.1 hypothetical protein PspR84_23440 [Pseudomonas sp. R84]